VQQYITPVQEEMQQVKERLQQQARPGTVIERGPNRLGETISPTLPQPERGQRGYGQRLQDLARAYAQEPWTIPPEMDLHFEDKGALAAYSSIPWDKLGFSSQADGYSWVRDFRSKMGYYPWEGPGDEETNLGNAINDWFYGGEGEEMYPPEEGHVTDRMIGPVGILYPEYQPEMEQPYGYAGGWYGGWYPYYAGGYGGGSYENPWWWLYPGMARGI
jgi:hypothetical protein